MISYDELIDIEVKSTVFQNLGYTKEQEEKIGEFLDNLREETEKSLNFYKESERETAYLEKISDFEERFRID